VGGGRWRQAAGRAQVVGVRGRNPTGGCLVAAQLTAALPRPMPASPAAELERCARATGAAAAPSA